MISPRNLTVSKRVNGVESVVDNMTEWIWLNGEIMPMADARLGIEDRGFQFADGVYEVIRLYDGKPFALATHLERLWKSAVEIQLTPPLTTDALAVEVQKLIDHVDAGNAMVYLQLTRGSAPRNHIFPDIVEPTLLFYIRPVKALPAPGAGEGTKLLSVPDERWKRCWIKSLALLPNVLAKNAAIAAGADEAAFVDAGFVTECSSSNLFAVIGGKLVTHPIGSKVLPGVTRMVILEIAEELGIEVDERAIGENEAPWAQELFITGTLREISWVSRWNDIYIGRGRCGTMTAALHRAFRARVARETMMELPALAPA
jgi:D-alanine transaminase